MAARRVAVVDTNVLVSGLLSPSGSPAVVLSAIVQGELQAVVADEILAEYERVLSRPRFGFDARAVAETLALLGQQSLWVPLPAGSPPFVLPDADDWPFIAASLALDCPVITGNPRHFPAHTGVRVLSASAWVDGAEA